MNPLNNTIKITVFINSPGLMKQRSGNKINVIFAILMKLFIRISFISLLAIAIYSCSKFDKLVKSSDYELKYKKALEYYNHGNYTNAMTLLEELIPVFKGTERAEEVYYYYSYCNYNQGDYG